MPHSGTKTYGQEDRDGLAYLADNAAQIEIHDHLRRLRIDWSALQELNQNGVAIFDAGICVFANAAFMTIYGLKSLSEGLPAKLAAHMTQSTQRGTLGTMLARHAADRFEFRSDVTGAWYLAQISPHPHRRHIMLLQCTEISEFKRRDALLSSAHKMQALGELAGGVAHDFNNVLAIIEGYARMMQRQAPNDHLERIVQAVRRGAGITKQMLSFGRHKDVARGRTNLSAFLEEQRHMLRPLLDARIQLSIGLPPDEELYVSAHSDMLAQMLVNAVTNARDSMEDHGGTISIVASATPDLVHLSIHDTGCGMDEETRKRALEPFFTTKPEGRGTGLGLTQIYGLLQQVGGALRIHTKQGHGTTLVMKLPRCEPDEIDFVQTLPHNLQGQTVLIVDDECDLVAIMESVMKENGLQVLTASSGAEALELQAKHDGPIQWMLSDIIMRDMSGPRLSDLFAAQRPETQVIYMSGYPATGSMARVQLPAESLYVAKPVDPQSLLNIMNTLRMGALSHIAGVYRAGDAPLHE